MDKIMSNNKINSHSEFLKNKNQMQFLTVLISIFNLRVAVF